MATIQAFALSRVYQARPLLLATVYVGVYAATYVFWLSRIFNPARRHRPLRHGRSHRRRDRHGALRKVCLAPPHLSEHLRRSGLRAATTGLNGSRGADVPDREGGVSSTDLSVARPGSVDQANMTTANRRSGRWFDLIGEVLRATSGTH